MPGFVIVYTSVMNFVNHLDVAAKANPLWDVNQMHCSMQLQQ
jgi:hypothetical protein